MNIDLLNDLYDNDIIYHYTNASTAIDFILYNNQLKFNESRKSNDPIESSNPQRSTVYSINQELSKEIMINANELDSFAYKLEKSFYQVCFCQNNMFEYYENKNSINSFKGNEELFGFTKPRMWDQYADKYTGVCIAFSKEKILSKNKSLKLIEKNIEYLPFNELSLQKLGNFQGDYLIQVGKDVYEKKINEIILKSFFLKHIDYSGENEYRIGTLYNKEKCAVEKIKDKFIFDSTIMLDISKCIKSIFISSYANNKQKKDLHKYSKKMNIPLIEIFWNHNSFEARDYKEYKL
ncbi:DUF2971 domain-containing protein [Wenyingzhuangia sp. chi5]|uniref:DUF2971 domain-containing protein n=1 Tax=Wenyingzhuangia gilva TaxID=3057677 RepID=A0ABT8VUK5_9FLAO|nr:DUF2971 domain-containing protein [Wenyingzhuangia sp. chi5]MDO3695651.1 DUF2971 domain-containing protein [Wenyingzhuangia sp. chi5]